MTLNPHSTNTMVPEERPSWRVVEIHVEGDHYVIIIEHADGTSERKTVRRENVIRDTEICECCGEIVETLKFNLD